MLPWKIIILMIAGNIEHPLPVLGTVLEESLKALLLVPGADVSAQGKIWRGRLEKLRELLDGAQFKMNIANKLDSHSKGLTVGDM